MKEEENKKATEKQEEADEKFVIKPYLKSELAEMYSPHLTTAGAMNKLNGWIRKNPELYSQMYNGREGRKDVSYSTRQVRLIVAYLDEP